MPEEEPRRDPAQDAAPEGSAQAEGGAPVPTRSEPDKSDDSTQCCAKHPKESDWERRHSLWTLIFNGLLVVISALGIIAVLWQICFATQQARDNTDDTKKNLRPWITVANTTIYGMGQDRAIQVLLTNTGRSPALEIRGVYCLSRRAAPPQTLPCPAGLEKLPKGFLGPGDDLRLSKAVWGSDVIYSPPEGGEADALLYVVGRIEYKDMWGDPGVTHATTYCFVQDAQSSDVFTACDTLNELQDPPKK